MMVNRIIYERVLWTVSIQICLRFRAAKSLFSTYATRATFFATFKPAVLFRNLFPYVLKLILQLAKQGFRLRKYVNHGFKKTGLTKFQSEEVIETERKQGK